MFWPVRDFLVKFLFVKGIASSQVSHKLLLQMLPRVSKKEENNLSCGKFIGLRKQVNKRCYASLPWSSTALAVQLEEIVASFQSNQL